MSVTLWRVDKAPPPVRHFVSPTALSLPFLPSFSRGVYLQTPKKVPVSADATLADYMNVTYALLSFFTCILPSSTDVGSAYLLILSLAHAAFAFLLYVTDF